MIKPLTSLRFVFALFVFLSHTNELGMFGSASASFLYEHIFYEGYIGVSFFFILSGFILSYSYEKKILEKKITYMQFLVLRLARIFPLHLVTLYVSLPLAIQLLGNDWSAIVSRLIVNMFMLQSLIPNITWYYSFNAPSWSISNEFIFYLLFPFLLYFANKKIFNYIAIALAIAVPVCVFYSTETHTQHYWFYVNPAVRLVDFIFGIALFKVREFFKEHSKGQSLFTIEIVAVLVFILFFYFHSAVPAVYRYSCYYWLPISVIILSFSFQNGFLSKMLSTPSLVYLGEISFGFYMFHQLVIRYIAPFNFQYQIISNYFIFVILLLVVSLLISAASYKFIEKPISDLVRKKLITKLL